MDKSVREIIRSICAEHLDSGHLIMGQCLTAVGWVGGTLPERHDMTELPCCDVAGAGFAVGAALVGKRPIYIIRYQGFNWFNAAMIVNYAAKSKELWRKPCPMFVRSIAMEGGIGPVAGSSHHALYYRMPGIKIFSPMTSAEYLTAYRDFLSGDDVVYVSEHRKAYDNTEELPTYRGGKPDLVLFPISVTRFAAARAAWALARTLSVAVYHIFQLKPLSLSHQAYADLAQAKFGGIVLDDDYPDGVAKAIAHDLSVQSGWAQVRVLGLENRTAGFAPQVDNLPPTAEQIAAYIRSMVYERGTGT